MKRIEVRSETEANVWQVRCAVGERVSRGQELVILESMKMEIPVEAPVDGTVREIKVAAEDRIVEGQIVVVLEA